MRVLERIALAISARRTKVCADRCPTHSPQGTALSEFMGSLYCTVPAATLNRYSTAPINKYNSAMLHSRSGENRIQ